MRRTLALVLCLAAGCALGRELRGLMALQQGIASTFGETGVDLNLSDQVLTVRIANSPRAALPDSARRDFADEVALYVEHHLPDSLPISTVTVSLGTVVRSGGVTVSRWEGSYTRRIGAGSVLPPAPVEYYPFAFACPRGDTVRVRFTPDSAVVLLPHEQRPHLLPRAISGSGARYSDGELTFWNKGDSAFVMREGAIVIKDCGEVG